LRTANGGVAVAPLFLVCSTLFLPWFSLFESLSFLSYHSPSHLFFFLCFLFRSPLFQTSSSSFFALSLLSLFFFSLCSFWVVFIGVKGSKIAPIPALSLRMGSGAFLPCHGAKRVANRRRLHDMTPRFLIMRGRGWHWALGFDRAHEERERQEEIKKKK